MKRVLVTGASGHIGLALVRILTERGYCVRAGVRDTGDPRRTLPLREFSVEVCRADMLHEPSLGAAVQGMDGVFHVASPVRYWAADPSVELIEPCVQGTLNVLRAAARAGVKKVVLASAASAVGLECSRDTHLEEDAWADESRNPFVVAKVEAERKAWEFAARSRLGLVSLCLGTVLGTRRLPRLRQGHRGVAPAASRIGDEPLNQALNRDALRGIDAAGVAGPALQIGGSRTQRTGRPKAAGMPTTLPPMPCQRACCACWFNCMASCVSFSSVSFSSRRFSLSRSTARPSPSCSPQVQSVP